MKNGSGKESPDSHIVNGDRAKTRSSVSGGRRVTRSEAAYGDASASIKQNGTIVYTKSPG